MATGLSERLLDASKLLAEAAEQCREPATLLDGWELGYTTRAGRILCVWTRDRDNPDRRLARLASGGYVDLSDEEWAEWIPAQGD